MNRSIMARPAPPRFSLPAPRLARWPLLLAAPLATLLAACVSPEGILPRARQADAASFAAARALADARLSPADWPQQDWWRRFGDPQLDTLISDALTANPTLGLARSRLDSALAAATIAGGPLGLGVGVSANSTRERLSEHGLTPSGFGGRSLTLNQITIDFSYDLDFWGRNRAALDAELGRVRAAEADTFAASLAISVAVARAYVRLAGAFEQRENVRALLRQRESLLALARERVASGLGSQIDIKQAEGALPEVQARFAQVEESIAVERNMLAALAGKGPDRGLAISPPRLAAIADPSLPSVLPADLVGRRPDVVARRWRIEASQRDIDSARAAFYPNINLAAYAGLQSIGFANLLNTGSAIFGIGPAVRLPLFGSAQLKGNLAARNADRDLAVEQYNQAVIEALRDVVDQLAALRSTEAQRSEIERGIANGEEVLALVRVRERTGLSGKLAVLEAEGQLLARQAQVTDLRARRLDLAINLVRALGGGFDASGTAPAAVPPAGK